MPNVGRLKELRVWGLSVGANIDMTEWLVVSIACGTAMCIAGKAASLARPERWEAAVESRLESLLADRLTNSAVITRIDGDSIEEIARDWLDLEWREADALFESCNLGDDSDGRSWLAVIDELIERYSE